MEYKNRLLTSHLLSHRARTQSIRALPASWKLLSLQCGLQFQISHLSPAIMSEALQFSAYI